MRGIVLSTTGEAESAQRTLDVAACLARLHAERAGPHDHSIATPGAAAARLGAHGVRTVHLAVVISRPDGTAHALLRADDPRAVEASDKAWFPVLRPGGVP